MAWGRQRISGADVGTNGNADSADGEEERIVNVLATGSSDKVGSFADSISNAYSLTTFSLSIGGEGLASLMRRGDYDSDFLDYPTYSLLSDSFVFYSLIEGRTTSFDLIVLSCTAQSLYKDLIILINCKDPSGFVTGMPDPRRFLTPSFQTSSVRIHSSQRTMSTPSTPSLTPEALKHIEEKKRFQPPSSPIAYWLWKWKMTIQGTFALSMLESWEQFILSTPFSSFNWVLGLC